MNKRIALALLLASQMSTVVALAADPTPNPSPSASPSPQASTDPCANVDQSTADPTNAQKLRYCQAADAQRRLARINKSVGNIWGVAAATCMFVCVAPAKWGIPEQVCTVPAVGAVVSEVTQTKSFTGLMDGLTGMGTQMIGGVAMMGASGGMSNMFKNAKGRSCATAAFAFMQMSAKQSKASENSAAAGTNYEYAKNLDDANKQTQMGYGSAATSAQQYIDGSGGTQSVAQVGDGKSNKNDPCNNVDSGELEPQVACAVANDKELAQLLSQNDKMIETADKALGRDLRGLFKRNALTAQGIGSSVSAGLSDSQRMAIQNAIKFSDAENALKNRSLASEGGNPDHYAGGGGGGKSKSSGGAADDPFADILKKALESQGLFGDKDDATKQALSAVQFSQKYRGTQGMTEDPTLPLFYRVRARYHLIDRSLGFSAANPSSGQPRTPASATP